MKQLWLVDVDGTVLDKEKMWQQLERVFQETFPGLLSNFRAYYNGHKGEAHSVEAVMVALQTEFGIDSEKFKKLFDQVNYLDCFDHEGWERLSKTAKKEGIELAFFTQGTKWVQEAKRIQLTESIGAVHWYIYEDNKMDHLGELIEEMMRCGKRITGLIDDMKENLQRAKNEYNLRVLSSRVADVILPSIDIKFN